LNEVRDCSKAVIPPSLPQGPNHPSPLPKKVLLWKEVHSSALSSFAQARVSLALRSADEPAPGVSLGASKLESKSLRLALQPQARSQFSSANWVSRFCSWQDARHTWCYVRRTKRHNSAHDGLRHSGQHAIQIRFVLNCHARDFQRNRRRGGSAKL